MDLVTTRLFLRELTWDDLNDVHALNSFPEVAEFNTIGVPKDQVATREVMRAAVEDQAKTPRTHYAWVVRTKKDNIFVGEAGMSLYASRYRCGNIFYNLIPTYWGLGYATEVAQALVQFGLDTLRLHRVEAGAATENITSIRVLEKVGMVREGLGRKILPTPAGWRDNYRYAILEDDPRPS